MSNITITCEKTSKGAIIFFKEINNNNMYMFTRDKLKDLVNKINEILQ